MKRIAAVLALIGGALAAPAAQAWQFEHGAGLTIYQTEDGRWYQQGAPHSLHNNTPAWSLGVTGNVWQRADWGVAWHADYVNLGRASAECSCTPMDENYNANTHTMVVPRPYDVPNAQFSGGGRAQGVTFTIEPYYIAHGWRLAAEAGVFAYLPQWDETVSNWQVVGSGDPQTLSVSTPRRWSAVPVVGASIGRGNWSLAYRHYFTRMANYGDSPPLWKDADVIEYKVRF